MDRKRITVPAADIKKRCICRQCGQERYYSEPKRSIKDRDRYAYNEDENHYEHDYPHPDTWEP